MPVQVWAAAVCNAIASCSLVAVFLAGRFHGSCVSDGTCSICGLNSLTAVSTTAVRFFAGAQAFQSGAAQAQFEVCGYTQITRALSVNLKSLVAAELAQQGLAYQKMDVKTDIGEDGRIVINRIVVVLPRENAGMCLSAAARLESALGIRAEVTVDGAGETGEDVF